MLAATDAVTLHFIYFFSDFISANLLVCLIVASEEEEDFHINGEETNRTA